MFYNNKLYADNATLHLKWQCGKCQATNEQPIYVHDLYMVDDYIDDYGSHYSKMEYCPQVFDCHKCKEKNEILDSLF